MPKGRGSRRPSVELERIRARLEEAEETLAAIRSGDVDAIAVDGPHGRQIFTLQSADQPYRILTEQMNEGAASLAADGTIMFCNGRLAAMVGRPASKVTGTLVFDLVPRTERARFRDAFAPGSRAKTRIETRFEGGDGRSIPVLASIKKFPKGPSHGFCLVATDISEFKRAEEALQRSETRYRSLVTATAQIVWTTNAQGEVIDDMPMWRAFTGMTSEEIKGWGWIESLHPDDRERTAEIWRKAVRARSLYDIEYRIRRHDGEYRNVAVRGVPVLEADGEIREWVGICTDITERKRAEGELARLNQELEKRVQERTAELQAVFDTVPIGLAITNDPKALHIRGNPTLEQMLGASGGDELSRGVPECAPFRLLIDGHEPPAEHLPMQRAARGETVTGEFMEIIRADGKVITVHSVAASLFDEQGRPRGAVGAFLDITESKRAEEALRESEQRVRRKLDSILTPEGDLGKLELADVLDLAAVHSLLEDFYKVVPVTTGMVDLKGKVLAVPAWEKICKDFHRAHPESCKNCTESDLQLSAGVPPGEFKIYRCKNNMIDVATPIMIGGEHMGNLYLGQFLFADEPIDYELFRAQARQYGFDQKEYLAALDTVPRLNRGNVDACVRFLAKLSKVISQLCYSGIKLARSSAQVSRANAELEASVKELEAFTYSVSHDLRAPLRHISGFSKILTEEFASSLPPDAQHHLQRIEEGTRRMGLLVDDLLNLGRVGRQEPHLQVAGLRSLVDEVIESLKPDIADRHVEWKIGSLPYVECDPGLIKQVFQNLLSNAVKFTRPREQAIIEIGQAEHDGAPTVFVRDNGVGFSMKYSDKLFGVFQRLHRPEDFEGTGVGLATVQRIIQKHGGRIWAEAELDKGATFHFTLGNSEKNVLAKATAGDHP